MTARLALYWKLVRLDKPIGILLLLWPTLWGLWLAASGVPPWPVLLIFVLGTVLMRSAGCAVNDWADRDFDHRVSRTRERVLTSGKIAGWEALAVAAVLALTAFVLILPLNGLSKILSVGAVVVAASYPFFKRFFAIPQAYLGIAFGFGIPMAFAAIQNQVPPLAALLMLANVFWAVAYDTEYAMVDREDDLKIGLRTSAITFGHWDVAMIAFCYAAALMLLAWVGYLAGRGMAYYGGLMVAGGMAVLHLGWIRQRDPKACFRAFLHNNWLGAAVFAGLVIDYL